MSLPRQAIILLSFAFISIDGMSQKSVYKIITEVQGTFQNLIDTNEIKRLSESLAALTALYSACAGTECGLSTCELTTALGLGNQGSEKHKALIRKYLSEVKLARDVLIQNCYLRPEGASTFSEYAYLTIKTVDDTIKVYYKVNFYDHGDYSHVKRLDSYLFKENKFQALHRELIEHAKD